MKASRRVVNLLFSFSVQYLAMDAAQNSVFVLAERRLAWIDQRQAMLAQNVANISVPHYRPRDARPFQQAMEAARGMAPQQTQPGHQSGTINVARSFGVPDAPRTIAPSSNGVALDEQLTKMSETETLQRVTAAIYKKYVQLFSVALGNGTGLR